MIILFRSVLVSFRRFFFFFSFRFLSWLRRAAINTVCDAHVVSFIMWINIIKLPNWKWKCDFIFLYHHEFMTKRLFSSCRESIVFVGVRLSSSWSSLAGDNLHSTSDHFDSVNRSFLWTAKDHWERSHQVDQVWGREKTVQKHEFGELIWNTINDRRETSKNSIKKHYWPSRSLHLDLTASLRVNDIILLLLTLCCACFAHIFIKPMIN